MHGELSILVSLELHNPENTHMVVTLIGKGVFEM